MAGRITIEGLALQRLGKLVEPHSPDKIIEFPAVYQRLCTLLSMKKEVAWKVLRSMEREGMVEIIKDRGIRVKKSHVLQL